MFAQESVQADCIINCNVYSNGTVRVRTGRGAVIGGAIHAALEVSADTVGSKAERATRIILGGRPCEEAKRTQIRRELDRIDRSIAALARQARTPEREQKLSKLRLNQRVAQMKLEKIDRELEAQPLQDQHSRRLLCGTAYPGTTVTIGHDSFRVTRAQRSCTIGLDHGAVVPL